MNSSVSIVALLAVSSFCLASCGLVTPEGARLSGNGVASIARSVARSEGIDMDHFKNETPVYLPADKIWYTCFEERGMLLAAGEQFTVFVADSNGRARLHRDTGTRDSHSRERLAKLLEAPKAAMHSKSAD